VRGEGGEAGVTSNDARYSPDIIFILDNSPGVIFIIAGGVVIITEDSPDVKSTPEDSSSVEFISKEERAFSKNRPSSNRP
jgi:hypothetical protein